MAAGSGVQQLAFSDGSQHAARSLVSQHPAVAGSVAGCSTDRVSILSLTLSLQSD